MGTWRYSPSQTLRPRRRFEQILSDVLSGELQPGESLPSERRLAEVLVCPGRYPRGAQPCCGGGSRQVRQVMRPRSATSAGMPGWICFPD